MCNLVARSLRGFNQKDVSSKVKRAYSWVTDNEDEDAKEMLAKLQAQYDHLVSGECVRSLKTTLRLSSEEMKAHVDALIPKG